MMHNNMNFISTGFTDQIPHTSHCSDMAHGDEDLFGAASNPDPFPLLQASECYYSHLHYITKSLKEHIPPPW